MLGIKDAVKRIYSGENMLVKHIILFILTGVPVMLSTPLNEISKRPDVEISTLILSLLLLLVCAVIGIYLGGYLYGFMKNSFDEAKEEILPDFDKSWFRIFFKGFPIQLAWLGYAIGIIIVSVIAAAILSFFLGKLGAIIIYIIDLIVILGASIGLTFVFAKFSKDYDRTGLYKFTLPFEFLGKAYKSVLMLILKLIPIFLVVAIINIIGSGTSVMAYIFAALGGYLATIMQYIASFCYVQIYKEEIE